MRRAAWVTCVLLLTGCMSPVYWDEDPGAGGGGDPNALGRNEFALEGDGDNLWLEGTPLDPAYSATYPNPEAVASMRVTIDADGSVRPECTDGVGDIPCSATPFFTNAQRTELGTEVMVWDLYGRLVAVLGFENPPPEEESPRVPVEGEEELTEVEPDEEPPPEQETPDAEPEDPADTTGGDTPPAGGCDMGSLSADMCSYVNRQTSAPIDCSQLDGVFGEEPNRWELFLSGTMGLDAALTQCEDMIYGPGREFQNETLARCPDAGVDLNNLMQDARIMLMYAGECRGSPLVLDLDGDGVRTTPLDEGVTFDLFGVDEPVECAWLSGDDDALLAFDRNGDGVIEGGRELFGHGTPGGPFDDGFAALGQMDTNEDGWVDRLDADFGELVLWTDWNRDGRGSAEELQPLEEAGVASLDVRPLDVPALLRDATLDNGIPLASSFVRTDGSRGDLVDVFFRYRLSAGPQTP